MSFYELGASLSGPHHDRRKDDRTALAMKLRAKLMELKAAGVDLDLEDDVMADEAMNQCPEEAELALR